MKWGAGFLSLAIGLLVATAASAGPLKLWHSYRGLEEEALEKATHQFTHETGIEVELLAIPNDAFNTKLTNAIPHGQGPDVFIFNHERVLTFVDEKLVLPTSAGTNDGVYIPSAIESVRVGKDTYGYPLALKCLVLFLNRDLVPTPPRTTDELVTLSKGLSHPDDNRYGLVYQSGEPYFHIPILLGFGGTLFDTAGKSNFEGEPLARSFAFVKSLQDQRLMPQEVSGALAAGLFNEGRAGVVISGPWFAGEISPTVPYYVAPLPVVSETSQPMSPLLGVEAAFVASSTSQEKQAQALARFLSVGEGTRIRAVVGRQVPASLDAYDVPAVKNDRLLAAFKDAATHAIPMPNSEEMTRYWEPLKLALRAVLQGAVLPEDAGRLAQRRYRALNRQAPPKTRAWPYGVAGVGLGVALLALALRKRRPDSRPLARRYPHLGRALLYVAPAAAGIGVLIGVPLVIGLGLSLFHYHAGSYTFVGVANFVDVLTSRGYRITEPLSFYFTLAVTVLWTTVNVALHVGLGLALALCLKDPLLKLRGVFRVLLIVPWAVPNYITALMWKGMFHRQFGAINALLVALHLQPVSWFTRWSTSFAANVVTNTWLGFPFMMVVALGALQSIPQDLYEAADVDGASRWTKFRHITLPLLRPALLPSVLLGIMWTFNMFNIIYLVSGGEPGGTTDILVSEAYRWAFERNQQYGFAAAYCVLIFGVLLGYSAFTKRLTRDSAEVFG
jgi:arabinogalactan oligomer/maltooligosaccharide transport system permease protein